MAGDVMTTATAGAGGAARIGESADSAQLNGRSRGDTDQATATRPQTGTPDNVQVLYWNRKAKINTDQKLQRRANEYAVTLNMTPGASDNLYLKLACTCTRRASSRTWITPASTTS